VAQRLLNGDSASAEAGAAEPATKTAKPTKHATAPTLKTEPITPKPSAADPEKPDEPTIPGA